MPRRFQGPPTAFVVIAVAVVQVVGTVFAAARQPEHRPLDVLAFVLLLAGPAALSLRRRWPGVMLPAAAAATILYLAAGYPWGPVLLSLALAIVFSAAAGRRWQTWTVAGTCAAALAAFFMAGGDEGALTRADLLGLSDVVTGRARIGAGRPLVFKSVGMSWEDLVVAEAIVGAGRKESP